MADAPTKSDWEEIIEKVVPTAAKMKTKMLKKGITFAKTECPECGGWLYGSINGRRNHFHMACDNAECCMRMME